MPRELKDLKAYLLHIQQVDPGTVVFIEQVNMFTSDADEGGKAFRIKELLKNYNEITALLVYIDLAYVPVYPISWQSTLGLNKVTKGMDDTPRKRVYKQYAQNCFPELKVTNWSADALCLIQFAYMKYERNPSWIEKYIENQKSGGLFGN